MWEDGWKCGQSRDEERERETRSDPRDLSRSIVLSIDACSSESKSREDDLGEHLE